jgi:hypothetical protein
MIIGWPVLYKVYIFFVLTWVENNSDLKPELYINDHWMAMLLQCLCLFFY